MNLLIVGANGLLGQAVLGAALAAHDVHTIKTLTRHTLACASPRIQALTLTRYTREALEQLDLRGIDACIYCVGVLPIGLDESAYQRFTVDLTLSVADAFFAINPTARFVYVSGAGADPASRLMPLRVKGQAETALGERHPNCVLLRPGVVAPQHGLASPYPVRRWAYALGRPVLLLASRLTPQVVIRSDTFGRAAIAACRPAVAAGVLEGSNLLSWGD